VLERYRPERDHGKPLTPGLRPRLSGAGFHPFAESLGAAAYMAASAGRSTRFQMFVHSYDEDSAVGALPTRCRWCN
jgi:hypothetical protein